MSPVMWPDGSGEEAEAAVHRTAGSWISMAHCPRQPQKITGGSAVWPAWSAGSAAVARTLLVPGIAVDGGGTVPADVAALHVGCHARTAGRASVARLACRMQRPAMDEPAPG